MFKKWNEWAEKGPPEAPAADAVKVERPAASAGVRATLRTIILLVIFSANELVGATGAAELRNQPLSAEAIGEADELCLECHTNMADDERQVRLADGTVVSLEMRVKRLRASAHGRILSCVSCHEGYDERHQGLPRKSVRVYAEERSAMCAGCHETVHRLHARVAEGIPVCVDCHSAHKDPPIARAIPTLCQRCGTCHGQVLAEFLAGGHAAGIAGIAPDRNLPNCATCHPVNVSPASSARSRRLETTALCIDCHSRDLLIGKYNLPGKASESYLKDFHGTTFQFLWRHPAGKNQPDVMVCFDCHGAHKVVPLDRGELAGVCLDCHTKADANLAGAWLGHQPVGPHHATAVWVVRTLYFVLIPLVLGGLVVNILLHLWYQRQRQHSAATRRPRRRFRLRLPGRRGGLGPRDAGKPLLEQRVNGSHLHTPELSAAGFAVRFSRVERVEHLAAVVLFTLLVLTGLPQSYPDWPVANWFVGAWGGIASTRFIHRLAGYVFVVLLVLHLARGTIGAIRHRQIPEIVPRRKDFQDAWQSLKHYVGAAARPKVGRFDYREKFEYWGLLLGGGVMTATGLLLIFPETASRMLPGLVLAVARVMHGLEATLAVLVVVIWHLYSAHLRPEIFPGDTSIFTGKIPLDRLREEHELDYERTIAGGGRPEPDPVHVAEGQTDGRYARKDEPVQ